MATSSIFTNIKITDPAKAQAFIDALEASEQAEAKAPKNPPASIRRITDPEEIRRFFSERTNQS